MYNKIIFSLFITIALQIEGMDNPPQEKSKKKKSGLVIVFKNISNPFKSKKTNLDRTSLAFALNTPEIIETILQQQANQSDIHNVCRDIRTFACINKKIAHHCSAPQYTNKGLIRQFAQKKNISDIRVALDARATLIIGKMILLKTCATQRCRFFAINDLDDPWYLETTYDSFTHFPQVQLLHMAMEDLNVDKTSFIITKMRENKIAIPSNSLALLAGLKDQSNPDNMDRINLENQKAFYDITKLLLENDVHPDSHSSIYFFTLLHKAALSDAKDLAQLLLQYDANPYEEYIEKANRKYMQSGNEKEPWKNNAFTLEDGQPKGWLRDLHDKIQAEKTSVLK